MQEILAAVCQYIWEQGGQQEMTLKGSVAHLTQRNLRLFDSERRCYYKYMTEIGVRFSHGMSAPSLLIKVSFLILNFDDF